MAHTIRILLNIFRERIQSLKQSIDFMADLQKKSEAERRDRHLTEWGGQRFLAKREDDAGDA